MEKIFRFPDDYDLSERLKNALKSNGVTYDGLRSIYLGPDFRQWARKIPYVGKRSFDELLAFCRSQFHGGADDSRQNVEIVGNFYVSQEMWRKIKMQALREAMGDAARNFVDSGAFAISKQEADLLASQVTREIFEERVRAVVSGTADRMQRMVMHNFEPMLRAALQEKAAEIADRISSGTR